MTILDRLADHARYRVECDKRVHTLEEVRSRALSMERGDLRFEKALSRRGGAVICEVKKASPSKGVISADFPYLDIAKEYEAVGADCVSCLTEPKWFMGSDEIFSEIRAAISIPMLRKDFTVDEYQIYQAKLLGADAVLLICELLNDGRLREYLDIADELGISALVETRNSAQIERAAAVNARIIGVNNRDLRSFDVNFDNALSLRDRIPQGCLFVAESGIMSPDDGAKLLHGGANAVLIGEALMRSDNKREFIDELRKI